MRSDMRWLQRASKMGGEGLGRGPNKSNEKEATVHLSFSYECSLSKEVQNCLG
jgi:hypothetical protein